jgi:hypothetical protein
MLRRRSTWLDETSRGRTERRCRALLGERPWQSSAGDTKVVGNKVVDRVGTPELGAERIRPREHGSTEAVHPAPPHDQFASRTKTARSAARPRRRSFGARVPRGTSTTGRPLWCKTLSAVVPSRRPEKPPNPRVPTTTRAYLFPDPRFGQCRHRLLWSTSARVGMPACPRAASVSPNSPRLRFLRPQIASPPSAHTEEFGALRSIPRRCIHDQIRRSPRPRSTSR